MNTTYPVSQAPSLRTFIDSKIRQRSAGILKESRLSFLTPITAENVYELDHKASEVGNP